MYRDILLEIPDESILVHAKGEEYLRHVQKMRTQSEKELAEHVKYWGQDLSFKERYGDYTETTETPDCDVPVDPEPEKSFFPASEDVRDGINAIYKFLGVLLIVAFALKADTFMAWVIMACVFLAPIWMWAEFTSSD